MDHILYASRSQLLTELRSLDKHEVILYTEDTDLYKRVRDWPTVTQIVPYWRERDGKEYMIAVDIYLQQRAVKRLMKEIKGSIAAGGATPTAEEGG